MPGIFAIFSRIASSTSFCERLRSLRSTRPMFSDAWLRPTEKPEPWPPTLVETFFTSGNEATISSTWRTFASLRARLAPTGMRMLSWVKLWSVCGMNSLPTSGASASAPKKLAPPTARITPRGVSVASRRRRGAALSRRPCGVERMPVGRQSAATSMRKRRALKAQWIRRS